MRFDDKFASDDQHQSFTLTADGCMNRMTDTTVFRDLELETRVDVFGRGSEADERLVMNYLAILINEGLQPSPGQSIESFIIKNIDAISRFKNA